MKRNHITLFQSACLALVVASTAACSRPISGSTCTHTISISNPDNAWGKDIVYVNGSDGCSLTVDGFKFELLDLASAVVDFEALGIEGISVTGDAKISYKSTEESEDSFMAVLNLPVAIRDGVLHWGEESLGSVSNGDVFIADATGLRRKL